MNEKFKKKYLKYKKKYLNIQKYMVGGSWRVFPLWTPKIPANERREYNLWHRKYEVSGTGAPMDRARRIISIYGYTVEMLKVRRVGHHYAKPPSTPSPPLPMCVCFAPIPTITKHLQETIFGDKIYTIDLEGAAVEM